MLENKNILMLCVKTFSYEEAIKSELERQGATVFYYDERPSNTNFAKGILRINKSSYKSKITKYYDNILKQAEDLDINYLFVIRGEIVPHEFLSKFKARHDSCKLVFYTWDSIANHSHALSILSFFDRKYTFDTSDSEKYELLFRPLFYRNEYGSINPIKSSLISHDITFIGTAHSDRFQIANKVKEWCTRNKLKGYFFYYQHGLLVDVYKRIFDKSYNGVPLKYLSFRSMSPEDMIEKVEKTKVVLDIQHPGQSGMTMRVIEALGAGRKIITTNTSVKDYSFYDPSNIQVITRSDFILDKEFVTSEFRALEPKLNAAMSLRGWVDEIFLDNVEKIQWLSR